MSLKEINTVKVENISIGNGRPFVLIAGPCVVENEGIVLESANRLTKIAKKAEIPLIFKSSYDKANRSSVKSFRGLGIKKGLEILKKVKDEFACPVISDVHSVSEVNEAKDVLDLFQVPAFLCRQTDLITACADTLKPVNVKKGQFMSPWEMKNVVQKIESKNNNSIMLTERGTTFGYNNLITDFKSIPIMRSFGYPVVFDATHSVQLPGGQGTSSGGQREFMPYLTKAALAVGVDALFIETHPDPENALSDGPNMIKLDDLYDLLMEFKELDHLIKRI